MFESITVSDIVSEQHVVKDFVYKIGEAIPCSPEVCLPSREPVWSRQAASPGKQPSFTETARTILFGRKIKQVRRTHHEKPGGCHLLPDKQRKSRRLSLGIGHIFYDKARFAVVERFYRIPEFYAQSLLVGRDLAGDPCAHEGNDVDPVT